MDQNGKLDIDDEEKYLCPSHYIPHRMPPIQEPITDERCHIHIEENQALRTWRRIHHNTFCFLFCTHYKRMREKTKEYDESK